MSRPDKEVLAAQPNCQSMLVRPVVRARRSAGTDSMAKWFNKGEAVCIRQARAQKHATAKPRVRSNPKVTRNGKDASCSQVTERRAPNRLASRGPVNATNAVSTWLPE